MYTGFVTTLKNVRNHPNADRMQLADCFGNTVCVSLEAFEGEVVLYFPVDGQLSVEYCAKNDLVRRKDENGNSCGGYLDPDKRNIRALKLRGEKSDGLTMPLESLAYTGVDIASLRIGDTITVVNGHDICQKYIPKTKNRVHTGGGNKVRKHKEPIAPLFQEHADTEQLAYNLNAFKAGDEIEITLKMHGTSQRTGYLPVFKGNKRTLWDKIFRRPGTPIYDYGYVTGTRRVVLDTFDGGFYGSNEFREQHAKVFEGKLWKGESVYYEVVGFTHTGTPIMSSCDNKRVSDKEFAKQYGKETVFSYGCHPKGWSDTSDGYNLGRCEPQSDVYVYRMTMTNEDGNVVEYTPDFMRYRCEQMGVKCVPTLWKGTIPENPGSKDDPTISAGEWIKLVAERFYDGPDPIGKTHVREGVVVRILNRPKFTAYKHKNHTFKVISGIIAESVADSDADISEDILAEF